MKEHGSKLPAEQPAKILKSLLKKPGQSKNRSQKNRVVINEKLNEFFAADYIILIKEECCADYEEDCDCCCQEHELIRLGNCKECRAELNLHFGVSDNGQYHGISRDGEIVRENASRGQGCGAEGFDCVELHVEDEEDEDEEDLEEGEEEDEEETGEDAGEKQGCKACKDVETEERKSNDIEAKGKCKRIDGPKDVESRVEFVSPALKITLPSTPPPPPPPPPPPLPSTPPPSQASIERPSSTQPRQEHQQETLSPPEGYKDVYSNGEVANVGECCLRTSLDYLQRTTGAKIEGESRCDQEVSENNNENVEKTNEPSPKASTNESRHRYLVETITMTTVTERRIVREISEEEDINLQHGRKSNRSERNVSETDNSNPSECNVIHEAQSSSPEKVISDTEEDVSEDHSAGNETPSDIKELSLVFKLGNSSLTGNSLKPNSAVRQLFPNPRFVSPPPAPLGKLISSDSPDGPAFLVNAENLRLTNQGSLDVESTNPIRRTIERNTLRRSLLDKYRANSRKKALPTKNLSLEERIRQLTCVDQEEDNQNPTTEVVDSSTEIDADLPGQTEEALSSMKTFVHNGDKMSTTITALPATVHVAKFALSDANASIPSAMTSTATTVLASYSSLIVTTATATTTTTATITGSNYYKQNTLAGSSAVMDNVHSQSTYKKLTDLFVHKRTSIHSNLPDLGIGSNGKNGNGAKDQQSKNTLKTNNSDVRKQFLASLAPLSCVAVNNADAQEDYYRHNSRMMDNDSRSSSVNYNTLSSYGLEDIEAALREDDRNYQGPPDVTKGTPITANRPDIGDNTADELLAFVEQDKFRTERIKQRYNDAENQYNSMINSTNGYIGEDKVDRIIDGKNDADDSRHENANRENNGNKNQMQFINRRYSNSNDNNSANNDNDEDNDDDELNDYGFNRRPSVTGIKQRQPENNAEDTFHRRTILENDNTNVLRTNFHSSLPNYYENKVDGRLYEEMMDESMSNSFVGASEEQDANTINRINTMQKQIDDIYQTIVENTNVAGQNSLEQPYTEDAYARHPRLPANDPAYRFYQDPRNSQQQYFQEQLNIANARTARGIATGAEEIDGNTGIGNERDYANGLPPKARRRDPIGTAPSNYRCNVMPTVYTGPPANGKCYRTMYFVPYNGLSDPTYQNIQRILPSHPSPSASYANHIERYPYPRSNKNDPRLQAQPAPQQLRYYHVGTHSPVPTLVQNDPQLPAGSLPHSVPSSSSPSFDSRLTSMSSPNPIALQPAQQTLHLHLHHQQPAEDFRISGVTFASVPHNANHSLQFHHQHHPHHRHHHQPTFYRLPSTIPNAASSSSSYTVIAPSRCATFAGSEIATTDGSYRFYQVHLGRTVLTPSSSDLSAQTFLSSSNPQISVPSTSFSPSMPVSSSFSNTSLSSTFSLPTVTTVSPQQTNFIHPNHVPETGLGSNMDTACRTGSVQSIPNNPVVSTPSTTSGFSAATSCPLSSSSSSSSTSSSSYSFSSPSSSSSSCSSSSSLQIPSSPSKLQQQQMIGTYATIERGVPEGAASAPSYDVSQTGILLTANPYAAHNSNGVQNLPTHTQNSVYYAMNV